MLTRQVVESIEKTFRVKLSTADCSKERCSLPTKTADGRSAVVDIVQTRIGGQGVLKVVKKLSGEGTELFNKEALSTDKKEVKAILRGARDA